MKTLLTFQTKFHDKLLVHFCTLLTLGENARSEGYGSHRLSLSVCPLSHISPLGLLFVVKTLPRTQQATKVEMAFSLKLRCSRSTALPALYGYRALDNSAEYARALLKRQVDRGEEFGHLGFSEAGALYALQLTRRVPLAGVRAFHLSGHPTAIPPAGRSTRASCVLPASILCS